MKEFFDFSGFTNQQYIFLLSGFVFFLTSLCFFYQKKEKFAIIFLTISGLSFFIFAALLDPFLNLWDERFHALVAKNSMDNFLMPTLYKELPIQEYNPLIWDTAHVWLHKQPLFIWQIALCFKIFGVFEFTLRLPSVIMATGLILITYRIGTLLIDKKLGYYSAVAVTFSWFLLNLVSGNADVDHNNVCFVFYVSASIWAWMEYIRSKRRIGWLLALSFLCACAVLTKWLTGLLVFWVWCVYLLTTYRLQFKKWKIGHLMLALAIVVMLVAPWQIYCFINFPDVFQFEYNNNFAHLFSAVENHGGDAAYYIKTLPYLYIGDKNYLLLNEESIAFNFSRITSLVLLLSGLTLLIYRLKNNSHRITLITTLLFVYVFFSIAATKMVAYPFCVAVIWFMSLGMIFYTVEFFIFKLKNRPLKFVLWLIFVGLFAFYQMNFTLINHFHTDKHWARESYLHDTVVFKKISSTLPPKTIIFNVRGSSISYCVQGMFYTDAICYANAPSQEEFQMLKNQGYTIAVFTNHDIPEYMKNDSDVIKIEETLGNEYL